MENEQKKLTTAAGCQLQDNLLQSLIFSVNFP